MRNILASTAIAAMALAWLPPAIAQQAASQAMQPLPAKFSRGEVRKVDKAAGRVLLKHEFIENLGMDPMAMMFDVRDRKLLRGLKPGDKVRFKAVYESGKFVLVAVEVISPS